MPSAEQGAECRIIVATLPMAIPIGREISCVPTARSVAPVLSASASKTWSARPRRRGRSRPGRRHAQRRAPPWPRARAAWPQSRRTSRLRPPRRAERRENVEAPAELEQPARLDHGLQALRRRIETAQDSVEDAVPEPRSTSGSGGGGGRLIGSEPSSRVAMPLQSVRPRNAGTEKPQASGHASPRLRTRGRRRHPHADARVDHDIARLETERVGSSSATSGMSSPRREPAQQVDE